MKKHSLIRNIIIAESVLLIPLTAMLFTEKVDWNLPDFVFVGILLAGLSLAIELIVSGIKQNRSRVIIGLILAGFMLIIWIEAAVGVFGSPIAGS